MTMSTRNRRFSYLATLAPAALGLAALTVPLSPAKAQMGVQIGPFAFGEEAPYCPRAYPYVYCGPGYYRGYYYGYPY